jgi:hypothetical protein
MAGNAGWLDILAGWLAAYHIWLDILACCAGWLYWLPGYPGFLAAAGELIMFAGWLG